MLNFVTDHFRDLQVEPASNLLVIRDVSTDAVDAFRLCLRTPDPNTKLFFSIPRPKDEVSC